MKEKVHDTLHALVHNRRTWLVLVTCVLITVTGIIFHQTWFRMLPLYISLIVMILSSTANRYAFILGGLNSIIYALVYIGMGVYGQAAYAAVVSFPVQIATFIRWKRHAYGHSTILRRLSNKQRVVGVIGFVVVWILCYMGLSALGSSYMLLDNTVSLLGIVSTVLSFLAYIESPYIGATSNIITQFLYIQMIQDDPAQITYMIFGLYAITCTLMGLNFQRKLYRQQQKEKCASEVH